jgi:hypothetical protein
MNPIYLNHTTLATVCCKAAAYDKLRTETVPGMHCGEHVSPNMFLVTLWKARASI